MVVVAVVAAALLARRRLGRRARPGRVGRVPRRAGAHAREILQERRFRGSGLPRPLAGLAGLARRSPAAGGATSSTTSRSGSPGGRPVVLIAPRRARPAGRRRCSRAARSGAGAAAARPRGPRPRAPAREDPAALERDADRAAAAGEWETAVRLRFRAGLLRLDARELIEYRPSLTTGEVADAGRARRRSRASARTSTRSPTAGARPSEDGRGREPRGLAARARARRA